MGLDKEIVNTAVAFKYKEMIAADGDNKNEDEIHRFFRKRKKSQDDYTDKFIQLSILLPHLPRQEIERFVTSLSNDKDIKQCASIFGRGLFPNPRKIKRVLRTFLFVRNLMVEDISKGEIKPSLLAKLIVIQSQLPDLFEAIRETPSLLAALEKIYRMQDGDQTALNSTVEVEGEDKSLRDQANKYSIDHPELRELLRIEIDEADTFINVSVPHYIELMGVLAVVRPQPPALNSVRSQVAVALAELDLKNPLNDHKHNKLEYILLE